MKTQTQIEKMFADDLLKAERALTERFRSNYARLELAVDNAFQADDRSREAALDAADIVRMDTARDLEDAQLEHRWQVSDAHNKATEDTRGLIPDVDSEAYWKKYYAVDTLAAWSAASQYY